MALNPPKTPKKINRGFALPTELAAKCFSKAQRLFRDGGGSSVELERAIKEVMKASSYLPDQCAHYTLYGNIYRRGMDLSSCIYAYRYACRLDEENNQARRMLASALSTQGQEVLYLAQQDIMQQRKERQLRAQREALRSLGRGGVVSRGGSPNRGTMGDSPNRSPPNRSRTNTSAAGSVSADSADADGVAVGGGIGGNKPLATVDALDYSLFSKALNRFNESLKLENNDWKVWVYKTQCHARLREYSEGLQAISRAISTCRVPNVEFYILRAKLYWAKGLTDDGNKDIRVACSMDPEHPEVKLYIARSYSKAEALYRTALQHFSEGDYTKALFSIQHALSVSNDDIKLHIMISKVYRMMGNLNEAYVSIQRASTIFSFSCDSTLQLPEDITRQTNLILNELALKYMTDGEFDKAVVLFSKVIASEKVVNKGLKEADYRFYVNRGDCHRAQKRYSLSIQDYATALDLDPHNWEIKTRLSLSHYLDGLDLFNGSFDYQEAEKSLSLAIEFNPKVYEYYSTRARVRYYAGDYPGSYLDYSKSLELNPENPIVEEALKQFSGKMLEDALKAAKREKDRERGVSSPSGAPKKREYNAMKRLDDEEEARTHRPVARTAGGTSLAPVSVSNSDTMEMLLNPRKARLLPEIVQQRKDFHSTSHRPRTKAVSILPEMNPSLAEAVIGREVAREKDKDLKAFLTEKVDTVSRSELFGMLDTAKELARAARVSKEAATKTWAPPMKAMSALAMKKLSQDRSKENLKHASALLTGVVDATTECPVPGLAAKMSSTIGGSSTAGGGKGRRKNTKIDFSGGGTQRPKSAGGEEQVVEKPKKPKVKKVIKVKDAYAAHYQAHKDAEDSPISRADGSASKDRNALGAGEGEGGEPLGLITTEMDGTVTTRNKYHLKALDTGEMRVPTQVKKLIRAKSRKMSARDLHDDDSDDDDDENGSAKASVAMSKEEQDAVLATPIPDDAKFKVSIVAAGRFWNEKAATSDNLQDSTLLMSEEEELQLVQQAKIDAEKEKTEQRNRELAALKKQTMRSQQMRLSGNEQAQAQQKAAMDKANSMIPAMDAPGLPTVPTVGETGTMGRALAGAVASGTVGLVKEAPIREKGAAFSPRSMNPQAKQRGDTVMTETSIDNFGEMNIYSPNF